MEEKENEKTKKKKKEEEEEEEEDKEKNFVPCIIVSPYLWFCVQPDYSYI